MDRDDLELGALLKSQAQYFDAPRELRNRIAAELTPVGSQTAATRPAGAWQRWWGMAGAFAVGVILAVSGMLIYGVVSRQDHLVEQVVDSHVRSLMVAHLSDVVSTDQHTVKPWFDGKLDYSPPVHDLATEGFPLVGGRMDYVDGRQVAALVYRHRLHAINVFVWPTRDKSPFLPVSTARQGFNVMSWQAHGMEFWAVSDVQASDLEKFAELQRAAP